MDELSGRQERPLVCELHAHTTWSDGDLSLGALVDVYGRAGFDVLAVTDHIVRLDDPYLADGDNRSVTAEDFSGYLAESRASRSARGTVTGCLSSPGGNHVRGPLNPSAQHTQLPLAYARSSVSRTGSTQRSRPLERPVQC